MARIANSVLQAKINGLRFISSYTSAVVIIHCLSAGLSTVNPKNSIRTLKETESESKKWNT